MTVLSTDTRVRADDDGRLIAGCRLCQVTFEQVTGVDLGRTVPWGCAPSAT